MMKTISTPKSTLALLCLATVVALSACSTTGMQRSEELQSTLETVDNDIKLIVVQLDAIGASLDELTKPGQADMKRAFDLFSDNASIIEKMERDFSKHTSQMESSGTAYFSEWDESGETYENADLQRESDARRDSLGQTYDRIAENHIGVKEAFQAYVTDVNEVEQFLSNDLTSSGIRSITSVSDNVVSNGTHLKNELQNLQAAIEETRVKMRQE